MNTQVLVVLLLLIFTLLCDAITHEKVVPHDNVIPNTALVTRDDKSEDVIANDDVITHNDRDVISRIPKEVKDAIDLAVSNELNRMLSLHFSDNELPSSLHFSNNELQSPIDKTFHYTSNSNDVNVTDKTLHRRRRDIGDAVLSEWSEFDECTVKCGGGYQVRTRQCMLGNCSNVNLVESRECGFLPCVSGTYVLDSMAVASKVPFQHSTDFKFFNIGQEVFFGYINSTLMTILSFNPYIQKYVVHQKIPVYTGIAFDILNTHRGYFLVVLEETPTHFDTKASSLYYFDMFSKKFRLDNPVRFNVRNPIAVKSFDVFGLPFIAVVNKFDRMGEVPGYGNQLLLVCDQMKRTISCEGNSIISITNVFYGRLYSWECPQAFSSLAYGYECNIPTARDFIMQDCNEKKSCEVHADESRLLIGHSGPPCPGIQKYLRISYKCLRLTHMSEPKFYKWDGIGLALVSGDNLLTYGAKDIEAFSIHNQQYLAVANYENDQGQHHLDSEVYIYDVLLGRFSSLQKLRTDGAVDFEFFVIGKGLSKEYFLAVANHVKVLPSGEKLYDVESIVYKWNWNVFVPFQCIKTHGARKWVAVTGENGEFVLAVLNKYNVTQFYGYDGWRFYPTKVQPKDGIFLQPENMISYLDQGQPKLLVYNENNNTAGHQNVFQLNFMKTFPKYELFEETIQKVQELNRTFYEKLAPAVKVFNETFNTKRDDIVFIDQNVNITVSKTFSSIEVIGDTILDHASVDKFDLSPADKNYHYIQTDVRETLLTNNQSMKEVEDFLSKAVTKTTEQTITGNFSFTNKTNISSIHVTGDVVLAGLANDVDLFEIAENALMIDEDDNVTAYLQFDEDVVVNGNMDTDGTINKVAPEDIILTETDDVIAGKKTFVSVTVGENEEISLLGNLNGKNTSQVLRTDMPQDVSGEYSFINQISLLKNLTSDHLINGLDIKNLAADAVYIDRPHENITSRIQFDNITLQSNLNMADKALINGVDVSSLVTSRPHLNAQMQINGTVTFADKLIFKGPLTIKGTLNGVPAADIVFVSQDAVIGGEKSIHGHVTALNETFVKERLNNVYISDIMDTFSNQTINSRKIFLMNPLTIENNLEIDGRIDGVNVKNMYTESMMYGANQTVTGQKTFSNVSTPKMVIEACAGSCSMLDTLQKLQLNTVRRTNSTTLVRGKKTFQNNLNIEGNMDIGGHLNGEKIPGRFVLQNISQVITGNNTFQKVSANRNLYVDSINGINITDLYNRVKYTNQSVTFDEDVIFQDGIKFTDPLQVEGQVDGKILPDDVVLTFDSVTLENQISFSNSVSVQNLSIVSMTAHGLIDGVNITYLNSELVKHRSDQIVKGTKTFASHVSFAGDWDIPGLIDGVNITELNRTAMRLDTEQEVTAKKTFLSKVDVTSQLSVSGLVDTVNLTDIAVNSVRKYQPNQKVTSNFHFDNAVVKGNVDIPGLINNAHIQTVFDDALLKTGDQIVSGHYFVNNMDVAENVDVKGLINNKNISEEIMLTNNTAHKIHGFKNFVEQLTAEYVSATFINGINLTDNIERALFVDKDAVVSMPVTFTNETIFRNLSTQHFINNVNFSDLISTAFMKHGNQNVTVSTNFTDVYFDSAVTINNLLNQVVFSTFENNLIYKCDGPNRPLNSDVSFENVTVEKGLDTSSMTIDGFVNGINITKLESEIVTRDGNHTIHDLKSFTERVSFKSIEKLDELNGFLFPNDFVLLAGNAVIISEKEFMDRVTLQNDFDIRKSNRINGVDVSEFIRKVALKSSGDTLIESTVLFTNVISFLENLNVDLVNGLNVSDKYLLLRDRKQNITGKKIFESISVKEDILTIQPINGIHLRQIFNESVLLNQENEMTGVVKIVGDVRITGNVWTNLLDNSNVTLKFKDLTHLSHMVEDDTVKYDSTYLTNKNMLLQMSEIVGEIYQSVDYFSLWQEVYLPYESISIDVLTSYNEVMLFAGAYKDINGTQCINSTLYSASNGNFTESAQVFGTAVTHATLLRQDDGVMLIASSAGKNNGCFTGLDSDKEFLNFFKSPNNNEEFSHVSAIASHGTTFVDTYNYNNEVLGLVTNTRDPITGSQCTDQSLFSIIDNKTTVMLNISECNVVKSIIITANQTHVLAAILVSSTDLNELYLLSIPRDMSSPVTRTSIATHFAQDIMTYSDDTGNYLVVVNTYDTSSEALVVSYDTPIEVYSISDDGHYKSYQSISVNAATFARHFTVGVYKYLAIATMEQTVVIYKHKGVNKWQEDLSIPVKGLSALKDMKFWIDAHGDLYAALLTPKMFDTEYLSCIKIVKAQMTSLTDGKKVVDSVKQAII